MGGSPVVAAGRTAEVLAYQPGQVLKLYREGMPRGMAEEEYQISLKVYNTGVTTPRPIRIVEHGTRFGVVYEQASGMTMLQAISVNPDMLHEEAARMARLHQELHARDIYGLPEQKAVLKNRIQHSPFLAEVEKERIIAYLLQLPEGSKLCHGDFHPDNIILGEQEWVIDWMTGTRGNPAGDVARTVVLIQMGTMPEGTPEEIVKQFARMREEIVKEYARHYIGSGSLSQEEVDAWRLPIAAARLTEWIPDAEKAGLLALVREALDGSVA
ncbi:phosphotransferase family protein [Paenibacillus sp. XY044]|uniref:phosphotransferase family protein n=1 Tax=Paenibacillus sp. XY044 TaxID=2026089 RepID=UPI0015C66E91|nr:aminoglycoside phosphotransferase family protein [Paenibacillus sp. XY044]